MYFRREYSSKFNQKLNNESYRDSSKRNHFIKFAYYQKYGNLFMKLKLHSYDEGKK